MGRARSNFNQKVEWLKQHRSLWQFWPVNAGLVERRILDAMRKDGLVSIKSHNYGIMDFGRLIAAARRYSSKTIIPILIFLSGCATKLELPSLPPQPPGMSVSVERGLVTYALPSLQVKKTNTITWDYIYDCELSNVVFVIRSSSLPIPVSQWPIEGVTTNLYWQRISNNKQLYLTVVTASNVTVGIESYYGTK